MLTFFVEDIYILLIILCHFAGSVSTTANTSCPYHRPYDKRIRKKTRLDLS